MRQVSHDRGESLDEFAGFAYLDEEHVHFEKEFRSLPTQLFKLTITNRVWVATIVARQLLPEMI